MEDIEFKINEFITIKLVSGNQTVIYIKDEEFRNCKFLLIVNPQDDELLNQIDSIDEAGEILSRQLETGTTPADLGITAEQEFWGHCSNIQAWVESDYDTRLLHSNLSFPLLLRLSEVGDPRAKKVLKDEIAIRFLSGYLPVATYLLDNDYLNYLSDEERETLFEEFKEIASDPDNQYRYRSDSKKWLDLGDTFRYHDYNNLALWTYDQAHPEDVDAINNKGLAYENLDQTEKAIECYKQVLSIDPEYKIAWYNLGLAYEDLNDFNSSVEAYKKAIEIDPEYTSAWNNLGYTFNLMRKPKDALEPLKKAIETSPEYVDAHNNLGIAHFYLENLHKAEECYKKALEIQDNYHLAWSNLSEIYTLQKKWDEVLASSNKAIEIQPQNYEALFFQGNANLQLEDYKEAEESLLKALEVPLEIKNNYDLKDHRVYYKLGAVYYKTGQKKKGISALNKCLELVPNYIAALKLKKKLST